MTYDTGIQATFIAYLAGTPLAGLLLLVVSVVALRRGNAQTRAAWLSRRDMGVVLLLMPFFRLDLTIAALLASLVWPVSVPLAVLAGGWCLWERRRVASTCRSHSKSAF